MVMVYYIRFKSKPPELEIILQKLKKSTDLDIKLDNENYTYSATLSHPSFLEGDDVWLTRYDENIVENLKEEHKKNMHAFQVLDKKMIEEYEKAHFKSLEEEINTVKITTGRMDIWYLMAATFAVLLDFGGTLTPGCSFRIPYWAWGKWGEVKDMQTTWPLWIFEPDGSLALSEVFRLDK